MKRSLSLLLLVTCCSLLPAWAQNNNQNAELQSLRQQAEQGNAGAQTELGYLYHTGEGVKRDFAEAVKWYRRAAEQGHPDAQYNLGVAFAFGEGVKRDLTQASNWYRRAAEQGHAVAAFSLGLSYLYGDGVQQNSRQAAEWFRQSAEQGYTRAQVHLGSLHHTGEGIPQDYEVAAYWYHQAAERGDATAQYNLGNLYRAGRGVPKDNDEALRWFRMAAAQDYALAKAELETLRKPAAPAAAPATVANEKVVTSGSDNDEPAAKRVVSPPLESEASMDLEPVTADIEETDATTANIPETDDAAEDTANTVVMTEPEVTGFADMNAADRERITAADTTSAAEDEPTDTTADDSSSDDSTDTAKQSGGIGGFFGRLFGSNSANENNDKRITAADTGTEQQPETAGMGADTVNAESDNAEKIPDNQEWQEPVVDASASAEAEDAETAPHVTQPGSEDEALPADEIEGNQVVALNEKSQGDHTSTEASISAEAQAALDAENYPEALRLLQAQALNGNAAAETMIGDMYFQGLGVQQDYDRALLWYRRAAKRNYADAQFNLGNMYLLGEGVLQDDRKARDWYQKAANQGHKAAARNLANIKRRISNQERYNPDAHGGPTQQELETAVEESKPVSDARTSTENTSSRRVVTPPIEPQAEPGTETTPDTT